ncbi:unnamed protein product [Ostreobium quekettii]|uniref:Uncharacterized protein n=1 Tax=Ostreobium quekettii TaxID=121088 RepID=A0A8S1J6D0_9CHLO|nr:unnamed protein product [Ostreobium quekettii]|eukprot:evm.model.scf_339EXC.15 EVM.evm.TU.scf_339EXC.15   scf_339EXC:88719-89433(+)
MALLWTSWTWTTTVGLLYVGLSLSTFSKVYRAEVETKKPEGDLWSLLVASFFGAGLVFIYSIFSLCLLAGLTLRKKKRKAGFWYGFVTSGCVNLGLVTLLCSLVLHGYKNDVVTLFQLDAGVQWSPTDTAVFETTFIVGYVAAGFYVILGCVLYYGRTLLKWRDEEDGGEGEQSLLGR